MEVLGVSHAASSYGNAVPSRPVDASKPAAPADSAPARAAATPAKPAVSKPNQVLIEPLAKFAFAYTFFDPDTKEVVAKWPIEPVIPAGTRVNGVF